MEYYLREDDEIVERSFVVEISFSVRFHPVHGSASLSVRLGPVGVTFEVPDLHANQVVL